MGLSSIGGTENDYFCFRRFKMEKMYSQPVLEVLKIIKERFTGVVGLEESSAYG